MSSLGLPSKRREADKCKVGTTERRQKDWEGKSKNGGVIQWIDGSVSSWFLSPVTSTCITAIAVLPLTWHHLITSPLVFYSYFPLDELFFNKHFYFGRVSNLQRSCTFNIVTIYSHAVSVSYNVKMSHFNMVHLSELRSQLTYITVIPDSIGISPVFPPFSVPRYHPGHHIAKDCLIWSSPLEWIIL